jgi:hypothetical protein
VQAERRVIEVEKLEEYKAIKQQWASIKESQAARYAFLDDARTPYYWSSNRVQMP